MTEEPGVEVLVSLAEGSAVPEELLELAVHRTFAAEGVPRGELSLTLLGDEEIQALNRDFLGKDQVTDVIAFSLWSDDLPVGDVYVGAAQAARQAEEYGVAVAEELVRLAIHGTLHVLGHDHPEGEERVESPMFQRQETLVREVMDLAPEA